MLFQLLCCYFKVQIDQSIQIQIYLQVYKLNFDIINNNRIYKSLIERMLPKRKLIKKLRLSPKPALEQTEIDSHQSLVEKLKSPNPSVKQEAITVLANLHFILPEFKQSEFIRDLINVIYQSNNLLCHSSIFAMANLCQLQPGFIRRFFDSGLDKALLSLSSSSFELLRPILIFFITVCDNLPEKYWYLPQGIRNSLSDDHLHKNAEVCLQFLMRTTRISSNKLSQTLITKLYQIYGSSPKIIEKSYAVGIMSRELFPSKEIEQILGAYMSQVLLCIDLAKEYQINFASEQKKAHEKEQINFIQQEMQVENNKNMKQTSPLENQRFKYFHDTIKGIEILTEFLLDVIEGGNEEWDEQDEDQEQIIEDFQKPLIQNGCSDKQLSQFIIKFFQQNMDIFPRFLSLSPANVPNTQNILYLFYHLLLNIEKTLPSKSQVKQQINILLQNSLQNLFSSVEAQRRSDNSQLSLEEYEVLVQCLEIGLSILLKNKSIGISTDFLLKFSKSYMLETTIFKSPNLLAQLKPSWLIMLQLYSLKLNPQKNMQITTQQNQTLGEILKYLIVQLPYTQLQEFRCQVIDTVFDVYSNEKFDNIFVKLGFLQLLETILKQGHSLISKEKKCKGKKNRSEKFIHDVLNDLSRFVQYKYTMIKK